MSLFVEPRMSPSSGGNNYAGAKLYFYLTGTTTPAAIYTDAARTTQHANPVIADSGGVFPPIWLDPTLDYRRVLKTSAGASLSDVDPYPGTPFDQESLAESLYRITDAEQFASVTPTVFAGDGGPYWEGNPRRYGAAGDGVTDDTTAVLNALAVMKATYVNSGTTSGVWSLNPGDKYLVTSPIHMGSTTASGGRIKEFRGNGAQFICSHTGIGVDRTNCESAVFYDLWVKGGTTIPKIGVLDCRFADSTSQGMRHKDYNLRIDGRFSICGLFNFGSETNAYHSARVLVDTDTPFGWIISDTGRYWSGAVFVDVVPSIPNMNSADPVLPGVSTTNNHWFDLWISNSSTYAAGGRGCFSFVGSGKHTFNGVFLDVGDTAMRPVMSVADTGVGGDQVHSIEMVGFNPHTPNIICWEHVSGAIKFIRFKNINIGVPTTADFQLTAGTLVASEINGHKIVLNSTAGGSNRFTVDTSFSASGTIEGDIFLSDGATISLTGNNSQKRAVIRDSDTGRTYAGWDLREVDTVSTSGTGEDNLKTYSITGATTFMGAAGQKLVVRAAGTKTGGAGNKTIKFYLGATSYSVFPAANDTLAWAIEAEIYTTASNAQVLFIKGYQNNTLVYAKHDTASIDLLVTTTLKLTGECANGADTITQTLWDVGRI